ncbi:MAG: protein O-mannosyl-transferase family [Anaerolineae bacterium]
MKIDSMTRPITRRLKQTWERAGDWLLAAGCLVLSLILYLQTLAPSVAALFDDSLEFPLVVRRLAIAHPTGYPLYVLLAKLLTLGPWYNVAWAVNLLSALAGALTVALVYLLTRRLTRRRLPALAAALALAVSPIFWSQAVVAEVYTLNGAFVAGLLWLALRWADRPLAPVRPFSRLQLQPPAKGPLFLPGEDLWLRLPPPVRRGAHRLHGLYRRTFPRVPASRRLRPHPRLYLLAALFGLALAHHRTVVLLVPALVVFSLLVERRLWSRAALLGPERPGRPRWYQVAGRPIVLLALALLGPLLLYLYLPLRGHVGSLDGGYQDTLSGFWRWALASDYGAFLGENPLARDLGAAFYGRLFWQQFGPVGLALALLGLLGLLRRRRPGTGGGPRALALTGLAFATFLAFAVVYRVPDVEVFVIPAFLLTAAWLGAGLDYAADLLRPRGLSLGVRRLLAVCLLAVFLAGLLQPLLIAARTYPDVDRSRHWIVHDFGLYLLDQPLPADGTVVGLLGEMTLLRYLQETMARRTDLETIVADGEEARRQAVEAALARGRAVYLTRPLPGLAAEHTLDAVTGLVDVGGHLEALMRVDGPDPEPDDLPRAANIAPLPGLELLGYGLRQHTAHWQAWARLRLWWRAPEGLGETYKISARLLDAAGRQVAAVDAEPVAGAYPTTDWRPGEVVTDAYEIPLPAGLPPGDYTPLVIVYDPATGAERGRALLAPVGLEGNPARPPQRALEADLAHTAYARYRDLELLGFTPPDPYLTYASGDSPELTLLWLSRGPAGDGWRLQVLLEGVETYVLADEPLGGAYPVDRWHEGQAVRQWPALTVPTGVPPGAYRLKLRVIHDGRPVPWGRGPIPLGSDLTLTKLTIGP